MDEALESLAHEVNYDYLTGLPSMTHFFELAETGMQRLRDEGRIPAVLFIDLNGMKFFNEKYGFAEGDVLLREFSRELVKRFSCENCCRFGQDHFTVFTDAEGLDDVLEDLIWGSSRINGGNCLSLRIGIYRDDIESVDISTACDRAKLACDVNRETLFSTFNYFNGSMLENTKKRQYIIDNLDKAIKEGWIQVYYQPLVRAANGCVCDEEALARWIDPVRGMLSPADFIPFLEDSKLIYRLDLYVVDAVLSKIKEQAEAGLYVVPQSINLSRADFEACDIVEEIRWRADAAGVPREKLTIEITESVIGSDFEFMKMQVERFRDLGFQVWMDDFGSGYSSLDVLQKIRFDLIKFDMKFMEDFESGDECKIILTELVKMAMGLGVETAAEGVETEGQMEFLREIGCTKLQGFFYSRPISYETILERYEKGVQIGFENPLESDYYAALGRINLYDMSVIAADEDESLRRYFNTIPMAILESSQDEYVLTRCNQSYRDFMIKTFGVVIVGEKIDYVLVESGPGSGFMAAVRQCARDGQRVIIDEEVAEGTVVHALIRRVAVNEVTGMAAVVVAVLAIMNDKSENTGLSYGAIAKALSADYVDLYYIDLDTGRYTQYNVDNTTSGVDIERHGDDFFAQCPEEIRSFVYEEDQEYVLQALTRENVQKALDEAGVFTMTYRLMRGGEPAYMTMKLLRMGTSGNRVILGVSDIDAQMKQREAIERMREERVTYQRVAALSGGYICIYTVDIATGGYVEYSATHDYEGLGLTKSGDDFFGALGEATAGTIYEEDRNALIEQLTQENVMREIRENGRFVLRYRLMLDGRPRPVMLRAAIVDEKDGPQLVVGVSFVEA